MQIRPQTMNELSRESVHIYSVFQLIVRSSSNMVLSIFANDL